MKKIFVTISTLIFSSTLWAATGYDIRIDDKGYDLRIEFEFKGFQTLHAVRNALIKPEVIKNLSPKIKSLTMSGSPTDYQSLMVVKSLGVKTQLLSKCKETIGEKEWTRSCKLQTDLLDGGKYMEWKTDQVKCIKSDQSVACSLVILGKTRPIKILGVQILNDRSFAVKAKVEALKNFFKLYYFILDYNISTRLASADFDKSPVKSEIENFDKEATQKLKDEKTYQHSFRLPEMK
ncbi:MAG: hypothetical protein WC635_12645 [Bacteriovorax sp.]|jgi:hypothetical protein